ncbi:MAG: hypothetical protein K2K97_09425 [Muribaculaceae bacterium]|nr:hypothetical protein [Muribaculaceae bacterium]
MPPSKQGCGIVRRLRDSCAFKHKWMPEAELMYRTAERGGVQGRCRRNKHW